MFPDRSTNLYLQTSSTNYKSLLREAARVLRSGGLLIVGEVGRTYVNNENADLDLNTILPVSARHMATMYSLVREQGFDWSGETISTMVTHTPSLGAPESIVIAVSRSTSRLYGRMQLTVYRFP
jgi:ubiquinone/menaquinone biosynthesis C-methylase UbiE